MTAFTPTPALPGVSEDEAEKRAIAAAEADIIAGKGVPHERVKAWLLKLAKGQVEPPPCA